MNHADVDLEQYAGDELEMMLLEEEEDSKCKTDRQLVRTFRNKLGVIQPHQLEHQVQDQISIADQKGCRKVKAATMRSLV